MPEVVALNLQEQLKGIDSVQVNLDQPDRHLPEMLRQNLQVSAVTEIPGVGPLAAHGFGGKRR